MSYAVVRARPGSASAELRQAPLGYILYVGSAKRLAERARRHVTNMLPVVDFDVRDFQAIVLPTKTLAGAKYVEELLIEAFAPVLNGTAEGVGSKHQGREHATQRMCEFNVLFPGRRSGTGAKTVTADELRKRVIIHLERTAPGMCTVACGPPDPTPPSIGPPTATLLRFPR